MSGPAKWVTSKCPKCDRNGWKQLNPEWMRHRRNVKRLRLRDVAAKTGMSLALIHKTEIGERICPPALQRKLLAIYR